MSKEKPKSPEYVMDFDKLQQLTGKSQTELADDLGVDKSFISASKTKPRIMNRIIMTYIEKFEDKLPLKQLLVEVPNTKV